MAISIKKLEEFLFKENMIMTKLFICSKTSNVIFVEVFMFSICELVIININKGYKIDSTGDKYDTVLIKRQKIDNESLTDNITNNDIIQQIEYKRYNEIDLKYKQDNDITGHIKTDITDLYTSTKINI